MMETDNGSLSDRNASTQASISLNPSSMLITCLKYKHNRYRLGNSQRRQRVERIFALMPALHGEFPSAFTVRFDISTQVMC